MECTPLNISVVLLSPGSVKSMLASNHSKLFSLPETSLWTRYLPQIVRRMHVSQTSRASMPTVVFARRTVEALLADEGPPRYMSIGGSTMQMRILKWLPRGLVLWLVWRAFAR